MCYQYKLECIPVGCVPPAQWPAISRGEGCIPRTPPLCHTCPPLPRMPPFTMHAPPPLQHTPPFAMHALLHHACPLPQSNHACPLEQPRMPPGSNHAWPPGSNHTCSPAATMHTPQEKPRMPPPVNRMINRCKNITLPQTSFAGGNKQRHMKSHKWKLFYC